MLKTDVFISEFIAEYVDKKDKSHSAAIKILTIAECSRRNKKSI